MKAFNNRPAYFRIIISSEIRNYIFKYIVLHLPSKCEGVHCSCYHFLVIDIAAAKVTKTNCN